MKQYTYIQRRIYLRLAHSRTVIGTSAAAGRCSIPQERARILLFIYIYKRASADAEQQQRAYTNLHHHSRFNQPCNKSKYKSNDKIYRVIICGSARTGEREETLSVGVLIAATRPFSGAQGATQVCAAPDHYRGCAAVKIFNSRLHEQLGHGRCLA